MADLTGAHFLPLPSTLRPDRPVSNWHRRRIIAGIGLVAFALAGCQSSSPGPGSIQVQASDRALPVMERVALAASRCWFKSGDSSLRAYRLAPELTSFTGRPRITAGSRQQTRGPSAGGDRSQGRSGHRPGLWPPVDRTFGQSHRHRCTQLERWINELRDLSTGQYRSDMSIPNEIPHHSGTDRGARPQARRI